MSKQCACWTGVVVLVLGGKAGMAALSGNLLNDGGFDTTTYLKNSPSLDQDGVEVPIHRFNQDADVGKWLSVWGPNSYCSGGFCGLGGFSLQDDPRAAGLDSHEDVGTMNRSLDPRGGGGYVMENTRFYTRWGTWIPAPTGHKAGPISLSFDFYLEPWAVDPGSGVSYPAAETVLIAYLYGVNGLPEHDVSYTTWAAGSYMVPVIEGNVNSLPGDLLVQFNFGDWWNTGGSGGWQHISTDNASFMWDTRSKAEGGKEDRFANSISQTYDYYALIFRNRVYHEDYYYTLFHGLADTFAIGVDNAELSLSVALLADVNLDGARNALDISGFIQRVTSGTYQAEADCNQDGAVNALDIAKFIYYVTGGTGDAQVIPEPATAALAALGLAAAVWRRRDPLIRREDFGK